MNYQRIKRYWLPVLRSGLLGKKPVRVMYDGLPVVLFRSGGEARALVDRCPHRGAALSAGRVREGTLECPYHGWRFDGQGQCRHIPGRCSPPNKGQNAKSVEVSEFAEFVWLGPEDALTPYLSPFLTESHYDRFHWDLTLQGDLLNVVENFLDATHTHHVHGGLIRSDGPRSEVRVEVRCVGESCQATYYGEEKASGLISRLFEGQRHTSTGRFSLPAVAEIEYTSKERVEFGMAAYLAPSEPGAFRVQVTVATPKGMIPGSIKQLVLSPFLKKALQQDRDILDLQRENLECFPEHQHISTELDVLRPHIARLLKHGAFEEERNRTVKMLI